MVRSLYSGVSGMKVHQTKMDVIGNNIANVNTYGFKSSRASFSDLYYQTLSSAEGSSPAAGGVNSSQIGYGVQFSGIDKIMERAAFTTTDRNLDVAIAGEGFFQVRDGEGNTYYTRAGILYIDTSGYLVDGNGNFVLGVNGSNIGESVGNERIILSVPAVPSSVASATEPINGVSYTLSSSNRTSEGNITFKFISDDSLPGGLKAKAELNASGITIRLNSNERFYSLSELNNSINKAIIEANGGVQHPAGTFTLSCSPSDIFPTDDIAGEIVSSKGLRYFPADAFGGVKFVDLGESFSGLAQLSLSAEYSDEDESWTIMATDGVSIYSGKVLKNTASGAELKLKNIASGALDNDYIKVTVPSAAEMTEANNSSEFKIISGIMIDDKPELSGGLSVHSVGDNFSGNTTVSFKTDFKSDYDGLGANAYTITATVGTRKFEGVITDSQVDSGLVTLTAENGETITLSHTGYGALDDFALGKTDVELKSVINGTLTAVPFRANASIGLTGEEITSANFAYIPGDITGIDDDGIFGGMKFVTTSTTFNVPNDTAEAVFSAKYSMDGEEEVWEITATIEGAKYTGYVRGDANYSTFHLRNEDINMDDTIEMTYPGAERLTEYFQSIYGLAPADGDIMISKDTEPDPIYATSAKKPNNLGLSSKDLALRGGAEGGPQSISDLTNIAIGGNGVITATHSVHGQITLGRIVLATFDNPQGLDEAGSSYFTESANSGRAKLAIPGESGTGSLVTSTLEMSNVDLSKEFTEMITVQRGFQANSRIITVSDSLLEELINLKR
ncbi:MAG: flagellar hook-basal body complex protein [Clostridiales bacterium]|nr:flagellar hook-basal body complex protein [Clostridiales bacterium]